MLGQRNANGFTLEDNDNLKINAERFLAHVGTLDFQTGVRRRT